MLVVNNLHCDLPVGVIKSNLRVLTKELDVNERQQNITRMRELHKDITYYSTALYNKVTFDEYMQFERELDELRSGE